MLLKNVELIQWGRWKGRGSNKMLYVITDVKKIRFSIYFWIFYLFLRVTAELQRWTWDSVAYEALCQCSIGIKMFFKRYRTNEVVYTKHRCLETKQSSSVLWLPKVLWQNHQFFSVYWNVESKGKVKHAQGSTELPAGSPAERGILKTDLKSLETELHLSRWAVVSLF